MTASIGTCSPRSRRQVRFLLARDRELLTAPLTTTSQGTSGTRLIDAEQSRTAASPSARTDPKHAWYVWSDGKPGSGPGSHEGRIPPNNWESLFGGSAWEWSPTVKQFYYHKFYKQQPDLNWRNPDVENAMLAAMRFWLDRGVAGFRLDAIPTIFEDPQLRDEPVIGGTNVFGDPNLKEI